MCHPELIATETILGHQQPSRQAFGKSSTPGRNGGAEMQDRNKDAEIRRMVKIRKILTGIFDNGERRAVLSLVSDYEKLTGLKVA